MMILLRIFLFLFFVFILMSCGAHTNLIPLREGNFESNLGVGGPFIPLAANKIPAPYLTVGANYGLSDRINIDGTIHVTAFFYKVAGFDLGTTWFPVLNDGIQPTWGIQPRLMLFTSLKNNVPSHFRAYPLISNSAAWKLGAGLLYTGVDFVVPLTRPDYDDQSPYFILSPFFGYRWRLGELTNLLSEVKWQGANVQSNQLAAEYISLGGYGAISLMITLTRSF